MRLVDRQVRTGRGICGHKDVTYGFPEDPGTHEDPEPAYPWDVLFLFIRVVQEGGDPMAIADDVWGFQLGSTGLGIPPKAVTEWLKSFEQGARDAQDTLEAVAPLTGSLQAILTAVQALDTRLTTIETKVDALAAAAGDPDAIANELAQRLAE